MSTHFYNHNKYRKKIDRILQPINELNLLKNLSFIGKLVFKNILESEDLVTTTRKNEYLKAITEITEVLNNVHKNNWAFRIVRDEKDILMLFVVIHYPEIIIKNSLDYKHKIKDLFVAFGLYPNIIEGKAFRIFPDSIEGFRTTLYSLETRASYLHSHLGRLYDNNFLSESSLNARESMFRSSSFCLGNSELSDLKIRFRSQKFNKNFFELFLLTLNSFVKWESLEGVPYVKISSLRTIRSDFNENVYFFISDMCVIEDTINFLNNFTDVSVKFYKNLDFYIANNKIKIKRNDKLKEVTRYVLNYNKSLKDKFLPSNNKCPYFNVHDLNKQKTYVKSSKEKSFKTNPYFVFNGERFYVKILFEDDMIDFFKNQAKDKEDFINEEVNNFVGNTIEKNIYEQESIKRHESR